MLRLKSSCHIFSYGVYTFIWHKSSTSCRNRISSSRISWTSCFQVVEQKSSQVWLPLVTSDWATRDEIWTWETFSDLGWRTARRILYRDWQVFSAGYLIYAIPFYFRGFVMRWGYYSLNTMKESAAKRLLKVNIESKSSSFEIYYEKCIRAVDGRKTAAIHSEWRARSREKKKVGNIYCGNNRSEVS